MDVDAILSRLEGFPAALETLLFRLPTDDWRWRPADGGWSILEIVNHLVDEEVEDFRARTTCILADPSGPLPSLDPEGIVVSRRYQERDPTQSLARFREERRRTLAWLRSLTTPRWENASPRPDGRTLRAGDLVASWAAHDARHLQQIAKRLHAMAARDGAPYSVEYAG